MKNLILLSLFVSKAAFALSMTEATALVNTALSKTVIASSKSYCTKGTMTCRTMYLLKDKATGAPANFYYDTFYSADRQVGSTCYFVPVEGDPAHYHVLTDTVFDGKLAIDMISPLFATIQTSADLSHITFANLKSPKVGTTQYSLAAFIQNEDLVTLDGITYDSADPSFKQPIHVEYFRVKP